MFSNFFIDRPIFAAVLSIFITLVGAIALPGLPIAQYPRIAPPTVQVQTNYLGANSEVVEESVATLIEQQVNGAESMLYMSSLSSNDGQMTLTVTFEIERDQDIASVDVQNREAVAESRLPEEVIRQGVTVRKQSTDFLMIVSIASPENLYDDVFLSNYATLNLTDVLARVRGVGSVTVFGARDYGMRIWLRPDRMARLGITATDVTQAIREQNVQAPAGQIGLPPAPRGQEMQYSVTVQGRLAQVSEYENIIVRAQPDGSFVRLSDIARVELGATDYTASAQLNGGAAANIGIYQLPTANALDVADQVKARLAELARAFPPGIEYTIPYDTTLFVTASLAEVLKTFFEALALVILVVFIFLQSWRATLIPLLTVPVSLIGTFAAFTLLGFSVNTLTLFAMVLAIGIVVDDAIVVVEAVQEQIDSEGMNAKDATKAAMAEVSGALVGIALVLSAVFVPTAFLGGITGQLYQQFAITLSVSVMLSALCALTLSPALCALMLRPTAQARRGPLGWFFNLFNRGFDRFTRGYQTSVQRLIRHALLVLATLAVLLFAVWGLLRVLPTGFVPEEDQGALFISVQLPEGASLQRTEAVLAKILKIAKGTAGVANVISISGLNIITGVRLSYAGTVIITLIPWEERTTPQTHVTGVIEHLRGELAQIVEAVALPFNIPPIPGLGAAGGFQFMLEDRHGGDFTELAQTTEAFIAEARKRPEIGVIFTSFQTSTPRIVVEVDREKVKTLGVPLTDVFETLQNFLGGTYVNDFNLFGRVYRVTTQAQPQFRANPEDINTFRVRSASGEIVPLSTVAATRLTTGPAFVQHYNLYRTAQINGSAAPGYSTGDAIAAMEQVAETALPGGYAYEWTGTAYQEKIAGGQGPIVLGLALLFVFLFLAALYESWAVPFAVLLSVPSAVFGAFGGQFLRGLENDVYAQIGLIMLIGLAAKNAILIVEYAKARRDRGMSITDAAVEASRLRLRPILMTSFAFIFGVLPLALATGAGAASRNSLGTSVVSGMTAATALGILMIPVLYVMVQRLAERRSPLRKELEAESGGVLDHEPAQKADAP